MDPFNNRPKSSVKYELESESQNEGTLNNNDYDLEVSKNEENEKLWYGAKDDRNCKNVI